MGRLVAFAARLWNEGRPVAALGIDEKTAFTIDARGQARLNRQGKDGGRAFFLTNDAPPERCEPGAPLTWRATTVQKLDAAYNDTWDFASMSGGVPSQRYQLDAIGGVLAPRDPYQPPKREDESAGRERERHAGSCMIMKCCEEPLPDGTCCCHVEGCPPLPPSCSSPPAAVGFAD